MKIEDLKQEVGDLIHECSYENFCKGYDPISDFINECEYNCELDPVSQVEYEKYLDECDAENYSYDLYKENMRWGYRCRLREKMAPDFFETYFLPFFNRTLKPVYDNDLTEELKFYKPKFDEWVFMILAVMTEYYFREKYPFSYIRPNWFNLDLNRGEFNSEIYGRYNAVTW